MSNTFDDSAPLQVQDIPFETAVTQSVLVQWKWKASNDLLVQASDSWPSLMPALREAWCSVFLEAAQSACAAQHSRAVTDGQPPRNRAPLGLLGLLGGEHAVQWEWVFERSA